MSVCGLTEVLYSNCVCNDTNICIYVTTTGTVYTKKT